MFTVFKKLAWFFKQHRKRYTIAMTILFLLNFVEIAPPALVGKAIDAMNEGTLTHGGLMQTIGIYFAIIVINYLFGYTWMYQLFGGANLLQQTLRARLMTHFLKMTPTFFEKNRTGDLMARATNDLNAVSQTAGFGILTLIDSTTFSATIFITMGILISWKLTLVSLLPLPIVAFAMTKYGKMVHERFMLAQDAFGDMNDRVLETIAGIRVIRAYVQEQAEEKRFAETVENVYQKNVAVARIDSLFEPTMKLLIGLTYLIGLGYGSYMVFKSEITLGELTSFNVYLGMLIWPMLAVGELINTLQRGNASLDRVNETLAYQPDVFDDSQHRSNQVSVPETIMFDHVTFRYPLATEDNLKNITLTIKRGQTIGIVGRTGSGKSTLIRQILREYPTAQQGVLLINGTPIEQIPLSKLHSWIGYVPQESMLFSRSIEENVRFGEPDASDEQVNHALFLAGFTRDISVLPNGLKTLIGEKGVSLSGGQKQRIALARALVINPEILILDDAMSAVDARTEAHIIKEIRQERLDRTTIIVTHRLSAVEHADWIVVLDDGQITEEGTHEDLVHSEGWYREQYIRQQAELGNEPGMDTINEVEDDVEKESDSEMESEIGSGNGNEIGSGSGSENKNERENENESSGTSSVNRGVNV